MDVEALRAKIESLVKQRAQMLDGVKQLDGAIGFAKGLLAEAEEKSKGATEPPATTEPQG